MAIILKDIVGTLDHKTVTVLLNKDTSRRKKMPKSCNFVLKDFSATGNLCVFGPFLMSWHVCSGGHL